MVLYLQLICLRISRNILSCLARAIFSWYLVNTLTGKSSPRLCIIHFSFAKTIRYVLQPL